MCLPQAVCWDMDGTIMDSEKIWAQGIKLLCGEKWGEQVEKELRGASVLACGEVIHRRFGIGKDAQQAGDVLSNQVLEIIEKEEVPFMPGAKEIALQLADAGVKQALVTASPKVFTKPVSRGLPAGILQTMVADDEVKNSKPHPEPYLRAIKNLSVDVEQVLVFEDSFTGVQAALTAGAHTVCLGADARLRGKLEEFYRQNQVLEPNNIHRQQAGVPFLLFWDSLEGVTIADLQQTWNQL